MKTVPMKRVTIVGENSLGHQIVKEVHDMGATGYTYTVVHGEGARGTRPNRWEGPNAKIEVVANSELARKIMEHIAMKYFDHYAIIVFMDDVEVLRGEKFGAKIL